MHASFSSAVFGAPLIVSRCFCDAIATRYRWLGTQYRLRSMTRHVPHLAPFVCVGRLCRVAVYRLTPRDVVSQATTLRQYPLPHSAEFLLRGRTLATFLPLQ